MFGNILFFVFLSIFILTAIITLGSLPGWIKIPDNYRKRLFATLILEVIVCVIILFKSYFFSPEKIIFPDTKVAMDLITGDFSKVTFPIKDGNEITYDKLDENQREMIRKISYELIQDESCFRLKNAGKPKSVFGKISVQNLKNIGLFNSLQLKDNIADVFTVEYYPFDSTKNPKGITSLNKLKVEMRIYVEAKPEGVFYSCYVDSEELLPVTAVDRRIPIVFERKGCYYLIAITKADFSLINEDKFVRFIFVKFTPNTVTGST